MGMLDMMAGEYEHESALTRKMLERVPEDKLGWKPHPKSMTMGRLASHLAEMQGWTKATLDLDVMDLPADFKPFDAKSKAEILKSFDEKVAESKAAMKKKIPDEALMKTWTLKRAGQTMFAMPKAQVLRGFVLNHQIHHRAQLGVYLRLNNVAVPSIYGPSADEQN